MINKNIQIWRGFDTPPTNYHLWLKEDSLYKYNGEAWIPISGGSGSGIIAVESLADLPEDAEIGSLASVNYQYTKEFEVIDEFKLEDSYLMEENAKPIKKFLIKDSYNWPTNITGNYAIIGTHPSLLVSLLFYYEYYEGQPELYLDMHIEHVSGQVISPEGGGNLITYNEETGKYEIAPMLSYMLNGLFKEIDFYLVGKFNYDTEELEKLTTSELNFFGQFFNYDNSYSYTEDFDTNDLLFNTFKGWVRRNDVKIVSDESELNNDAPAGSIASVDVDNYEEYWAKPTELTSLPIWKLNIDNPEQLESPDTIGIILQELLSFLLNVSPVKQIKINCPWTHISQVPQQLKLGKNITCIIIPKHMNMMNMGTFPQLTIWADNNTFEIFDAASASTIPIVYTDDSGNIHTIDDVLIAFNAELAAQDHYWATCTHKDANNEHIFDASHLIDDLISVKTYKGEVKTDFFLKDKTQWTQFASLADDAAKGIFQNSESVKFKGYVNVDTLKDVDRLYDSLNVNEMALAVPSTAVLGMMSNQESGSPTIPLAMDSYLPWAISGILDSHIELSPELFNIGVTVGVDSGFELRTYFMLDRESPQIKCPDMLLFAKVELNLKELVGDLLTTLVGLPIDLPETITVSVGKILRFGGGSSGGGGSLKTLDNGTYLTTCTQTGVVPYKQSSSQLPTSDYFTIFIQCPKDTDHNNYYHVQQTAYGRTGNASGRVWTRLCLVNTNGNYDNFDWVEIPSADMLQSAFTDIFDALDDHSYQLSEAKTNISSLSHKYAYNYDMDKALSTGIIGYTTTCTKGLPGGIKENYTVLVFGSSDYDPNFRTVQQIAYGRTGSAANRVWTRLIFKHKNSTSKDEYHSWVEITNPAVDLSGIESDINNLYDTVIPGIEQDIANLESGLLTEGSVTVDKLGDDVKDMITNSGVPVVSSSDSLSADAVVGSFASIVVEGKTQLWVKNDTGWQEYGKESDPEEITNITDIL